MGRLTRIILAASSGMVLVALALWAWQGSADWASDWQPARPEVIAWAIRSLAIAGGAMAQVLVTRYVVGAVYRRRAMDDVLSLSSAVACAISLVSAAALALAGR